MARFIIACMALAPVVLLAQEGREERGKSPTIARAAAEQLPADLKKEGVSLPLNLKEGDTYTFLLEGHQEALKGSQPSTSPEKPGAAGEREPGAKAGSAMAKELTLRVAKKEGDAWVLVGMCKPRGAAPTDKNFETATFSVAKDGKVTCLDADGKPRPETKPLEPEKAHVKTYVEHLFGYRLHDVKLEPGREYTMPGSIHDLLGHEGSAGALSSQAEKGVSREESSPRPSSAQPAQGGEHHMRFEGVSSTEAKKKLAWFTILPAAASAKPGTTPSEKPGTTEQPGLALGASKGLAAYAVDDGILEKLAIGGMSVRRLPSIRVDIGN